MHPCTSPLVLAPLGEHDNIHPPRSTPSSCLIWGLSSVSVTQYQRPCFLMVLTERGLTRRDRLSHAAGDAPLACCLSLHLTAVLWMQSDNGLRMRCECLFLQHDTRCQSSRTLKSLQLLRPLYSTRWCRAAFVTCWAKRVGTPGPCGVFSVALFVKLKSKHRWFSSENNSQNPHTQCRIYSLDKSTLSNTQRTAPRLGRGPQKQLFKGAIILS